MVQSEENLVTGAKGLIEINAFDLYKPLGDDACFVFLNSAVRSMFDMENPLATYNFTTFWPRNDVVDVKVLLYSHLLFIDDEPLSSIWAGHGLVICLWLRGLHISDIGMVIIG